MTGKYQAPTVKKTFQILRLMSKTEKGMRISELSKGLNISKSTVHGITSALEELGAIMRNPKNKSYTLGVTLFELGKLAHTRIDLKDIARPFLEHLMIKTQESVFLGVRNRNHATILDIVESTMDLKITSPVGTRIPLMAGATGKIFLSSMTEEQIREFIKNRGFYRFTDKTITDTEKFIKEITEIRKMGYALDDEEYISGVKAVAAPINGEGTLESAIWVVGFKPSMGNEKIKLVITEILKTADAIRKKIKEKAVT